MTVWRKLEDEEVYAVGELYFIPAQFVRMLCIGVEYCSCYLPQSRDKYKHCIRLLHTAYFYRYPVWDSPHFARTRMSERHLRCHWPLPKL